MKNHWNSAKRRLTRMPANEEILGTGTTAGDSETPSSSLKRLKFLPKQTQPRALSVVLLDEPCHPISKEKNGKLIKKASKRKIDECPTEVEEKDYRLEEWRESPKKSPRKQAAVSKVNQFLSGIAPWKEGGLKGFVTPPLLTNMTEVEVEIDGEREKIASSPLPRPVYSHELPEDHEVADVLLNLLSPVSAIAGSKLFSFNDSSSIVSRSATILPTSATTNRQHEKDNGSLSKNDETDGELTELCIRHKASMSASTLAPLVFQTVNSKEKNGEGNDGHQGTGGSNPDILPLPRSWLKTDSKDLLNHFRSLSALADLATTELISPSGCDSPTPVRSLSSKCVLLPRPSGGGLVGFSRMNTPLKILTVSQSLFRSNEQLSPPLSTTSLSSSDGQWTSSQSSRSHSRSSADTSLEAQSPISISADSLTTDCPSSGSGTDTSRDSIMKAATFLSVDVNGDIDRKKIKLM